MKKLSIILCVVILLTTLLCACGTDPLIGSWTTNVDGIEINMTFEEDSTGHISALGGLLDLDYTYVATDDTLTLTPDGDAEGLFESNELPYSFDGDTLVITDGEDTLQFSREKE